MIEYFTIGCLVIVCICLALTLRWLSRAATFMDITAKIRNGEPLTSKEQRLIDRAIR